MIAHLHRKRPTQQTNRAIAVVDRGLRVARNEGYDTDIVDSGGLIDMRDLERRPHGGILRRHLPITEIAAETGFAEISHFTHTFKRETGVSPHAYRRGQRHR